MTAAEDHLIPQPVRDPLRLLAVGDSVARGWWACIPRVWQTDGCGIRLYGVPLRWFDHVSQAYPVELKRLLSAGTGRRVTLDQSPTDSGARTWHLVRDGVPSARLAAAVERRPEVVTVTLGANDVLSNWYGTILVLSLTRPFQSVLPDRLLGAVRRPLAPHRDELAEVAEQASLGLTDVLRYLRTALPDAVIVVSDYLGSGGDPEISEVFVKPINKAVAAAVARVDDVALVQLDAFVRGALPDAGTSLLSRFDRAHPSAAGQALIAQAIAGAALARLRVER